MKITDVAISVIANPHSEMVTAGVKGGRAAHDIVFLQIKTDEGLEGHAFAWGGRSGQATAHLIGSIIPPLLIGQDPLNREQLWQQVRRMDRWWGFLPIYAHGPVDVALWDLGAKAPQEPFCFGVKNPIRIDAEGFVHVPEGPGLGAEIDFDLLDNNLICKI
jgi:L-alanine-DL-glutamate epimerase-like enolase superfamily enzyme